MPTDNSKKQRDNKKRYLHLNYTTIADQLRTTSYRKDSHQLVWFNWLADPKHSNSQLQLFDNNM